MRSFATSAFFAALLVFGLLGCDAGGPDVTEEPTGSDYIGVVESQDNDSTITVSEVSPFEINADADRIGPGGLDEPAVDTVYAIESTTVVDSAGMTGQIILATSPENLRVGNRVFIGK